MEQSPGAWNLAEMGAPPGQPSASRRSTRPKLASRTAGLSEPHIINQAVTETPAPCLTSDPDSPDL